MAVTTVATSTFLTDITLMLRDDIAANVTDPISAKRGTDDKFVMTSYPERPVKYPIVTVKSENIATGTALGMQSTLHYTNLPVEVRVWARNVAERDQLGQQIINQIRSTRISKYLVGGLIDFEVTAAINVDENGDAGIKSKVIKITFRFILGS